MGTIRWRDWWMEAPVPNAGDAFVACASPFAALAPSHFSCSVVGGHVSAEWGTKGSNNNHGSPPLLMADVRSMPGMEGAPVLDARGGGVIGVLTPPLVRYESGTVSGAGGQPRGSRVGSTQFVALADGGGCAVGADDGVDTRRARGPGERRR